MNEEFYKRLMEESPIGYAYHRIICDDFGEPCDYEFLEANSAFEKFTGLEREVIIGHRASEIFPKAKDQDFDWIQFYGDVAINGVAADIEDFSALNNRWNKINVSSPERYYFITRYSDISKEMKTLSELDQQQKEILNSVQEGVIVYDLDLNHLIWNPYMEKLTGIPAEDVIGHHQTELFPFPFETGVMSSLEKLLTTDITTNLRFPYDIKKTGKTGWASETSSQLKNSKGELIGIIGIVHDITEYKKREADLVISEQRYRLIFERASLGIANTSLESEYLDVNQKFCSILGYSHDELLKIKFTEITHPDDQANSKEGVLGLINGNLSVFSTKKRYIKKDGAIVWVDLSSALVRDVEGEPLYFTTIISDITEQRIKDEALMENERLLRESQSVAHIGSYNTDFIKGLWRSSPELDNIFGIDHLYNRSIQGWVNIVHAEWQTKMSDYLDELLAEKTRFDFKYKITRINDHEERWVHGLGELTYDEAGGIIGLIGTIQDITSQKQIEENLTKSEEQFKIMFEEAPLGIGVVDFHTGKTYHYNRKYAEILGRTNEDIRTMDWIKISHPDDLPKNMAFREEMRDRKINGFNMDKRYFKPDGSTLWINLTITLLDSLDSENPRELCMIEDITERKRNEETILNLSYKDQITGLNNRRFYEEELRRLNAENNLPIALIMLDVNGLKLTNDAFGHRAGDQLLKKVGEILNKECGADGITARIGGDEFVILLPNTNEKQAKKLIERIGAVSAKEKTENLIMSLSIGLGMKYDAKEDMNEVFKEAEDDMYRHKLSESSSMRSRTIDLIMNSLYEKNEREMLHSKRVGEICAAIAAKMNFLKDDVNQMRIAGLMHDIGKIGISEAILNNPEKLTSDEWHEIKRHSEIGYRILSSANEFSEIAEYILSHHERWDGQGYPRGLKASEISIQARIITVADAFDAMTSYRTYGKELSESEAVKELNAHAGKQFDPDIVRIFTEEVLGHSFTSN